MWGSAPPEHRRPRPVRNPVQYAISKCEGAKDGASQRRGPRTSAARNPSAELATARAACSECKKGAARILAPASLNAKKELTALWAGALQLMFGLAQALRRTC